jgi:IS30 family transposase
MAPISLAEPSGRYLSLEEREEIALLRAQQVGVREIARRIGRDPATVSRELHRNAATRGGKLEYRPLVAQWKAQQAAKRPKEAKLSINDQLREYVQDRLAGNVRRPDGTIVVGPQPPAWKGLNKPFRQDRRWATSWSPEQISQRLKVEFPQDDSMRISHEAISQSLFIQAVARSDVSSSPACEPAGHCASLVLERGTARRAMSQRTSFSPSGPRRLRTAPFPGIGNLNAVCQAAAGRAGAGSW